MCASDKAWSHCWLGLGHKWKGFGGWGADGELPLGLWFLTFSWWVTDPSENPLRDVVDPPFQKRNKAQMGTCKTFSGLLEPQLPGQGLLEGSPRWAALGGPYSGGSVPLFGFLFARP